MLRNRDSVLTFSKWLNTRSKFQYSYRCIHDFRYRRWIKPEKWTNSLSCLWHQFRYVQSDANWNGEHPTNSWFVSRLCRWTNLLALRAHTRTYTHVTLSWWNLYLLIAKTFLLTRPTRLVNHFLLHENAKRAIIVKKTAMVAHHTAAAIFNFEPRPCCLWPLCNVHLVHCEARFLI